MRPAAPDPCTSRTRVVGFATALGLVAACAIPVDDAPCPCGPGWYCCPSSNTCMQEWSSCTTGGPLAEKLVAYYPFNGNAQDESGNQNHGQVVGASLVADRFGNPDSAYHFDGPPDRIAIQVSPTSDFVGSPALSVGLWVNVDSMKQWEMTALGLRAPGSFSYSLGLARADDAPSNIEDVPTAKLSTDGDHMSLDDVEVSASQWTSPLDIRSWHQLYLTFGHGRLCLYVDGEPVPEPRLVLGSFADITSSSPTFIGAWATVYGARDYFSGAIDDVRIYTRSLEGYEIEALFREGDWP